MGIDVQVESERGEVETEVLDPDEFTERLLPGLHSEQSHCLRWVDEYGNTLFNQYKMPFFWREIAEAVSSAVEPKVRAHCERVLALVRSALEREHIYVRFVGD